MSKFGKLGGLRAGTPGMVKGDPHKLFTIRGAGTDAAGNLYVALGRNWTILRKFTPERNLVWEMESYTFVDGVSAAPGSDGKEIYGREEIFEFDYTKPAGQRAWTLKAITADFDRHPDDPRSTGKGTAWIRIVDGHRLLFVVDQLAGAMPVFCFDTARNGQIALDSGLRKGQGWAVWPDARGNVWYTEGERIVMEPLTGFAPDGKPIYGAAKTFKRPAQFLSVERIVYDPAADTMFLGGFTKDNPDPGGAWGLVGTEILRFDNWLKGPVPGVRIKLPFKTWNKGSTGEMIMPKSVDVAGDYVFVCYVSKSQTPGIIPPVRIYHSKTGKFMGELRPGGVAGGHHGYVDIAHGMSAFKRANGEYVVLVEEDNRAKIMLYRWTPPPPTTTTSTEQRARSSKSISRKR